jgi:hypothetical protein
MRYRLTRYARSSCAIAEVPDDSIAIWSCRPGESVRVAVDLSVLSYLWIVHIRAAYLLHYEINALLKTSVTHQSIEGAIIWRSEAISGKPGGSRLLRAAW